MKALILAGGFPQIDLIQKLKARGIQTILADYYQNPVARGYADKFYRISTLDVEAIRKLAIDEKVDFLITVCTDQALLTVAQVSETLGLPCYIDYKTAQKVTNKAYMKKVFEDKDIPSMKYIVASDFDINEFLAWDFPLVVKPVDCNSSKGVRKVENIQELRDAFYEAVALSRTGTAIVEEYFSGKELSIDVYVEDGQAKILDITTSDKLKHKDRFVIFRTWHPANISGKVRNDIEKIVQKVAEAFEIKNSPMLIQMLTDGEKTVVIEFSARTGGGVKHLSILRRTGVDIISTAIDLTLGGKPHVDVIAPVHKYMVDEYIYCFQGRFDHVEGFDRLKKEGTITDFYIFKGKGSLFDTVENSGDRVGGFTVEGDSIEELYKKHVKVNQSVRIVSESGTDIMRHDMLIDFNEWD